MKRALLLSALSAVLVVCASGSVAAPQPAEVAAGGADVPADRASAILSDASAPLDSRMDALEAIAEADLATRPAIVKTLRQVMIDAKEPVRLRLAILGRLTELYFPWALQVRPIEHIPASERQAHAALASFNDDVRKLLDDPVPTVQKSAFGWLAMFQDPETMKRAVRALQGGQSALTTADAIDVLTFADPTPYLPDIYAAYRKTADPLAREEALHVLGGYKEAHNDLVAVALSPEEPVRLRFLALSALFTSDRDEFPKLVAPLLGRTGQDADEISVRVITMMRVERSQPPYRQRKLKGYDDDFDRGVRALAERRDTLGDLAHLYLLNTDPNYALRDRRGNGEGDGRRAG